MEDENNWLADKLTAISQKCDVLDSDMKTLKAEKSDLNGRLKMVLSELDTAIASLYRMNTDGPGSCLPPPRVCRGPADEKQASIFFLYKYAKFSILLGI